MSPKHSGRRRFLKEGSAALAGLAVESVRSASGQTLGSEKSEAPFKETRAYGERSRFENSARWPLKPEHITPATNPQVVYAPSMTPLQDLIGIITPSGLHYQVGPILSTPKPDLDPRQHRLLIHGLVDRPLILTMEELKRLPSVSRIHFLECGANSSPAYRNNLEFHNTAQQQHGHTSCSEWTGVPLSLLLQEAGVQKGASWVVSEGAEPARRNKSMPLEKAMDDVIVAYGQNGEAVRPEQGYPVRLVVPGWVGVYNTKWLRRIKLVDQPYMVRDDSVKYTTLLPDGKSRWFRFEHGPKSVITYPSGGHRLPGPGFYEIRGLAWSGGGYVKRVEISFDGGRSWKDAPIQDPVHRFAHSRFRLPWTWNGEEVVIQSRCTDERGESQPTIAEVRKLCGDDPDKWQLSEVGSFNGVQPWRINRDGSVDNAMFS